MTGRMTVEELVGALNQHRTSTHQGRTLVADLMSHIDALRAALHGMMIFYGMDEDPSHDTCAFVWQKAREAYNNSHTPPPNPLHEAAPELLAAAVNAERHLRRLSVHDGDVEWNPEIPSMAAANQLREAIAKAQAQGKEAG